MNKSNLIANSLLQIKLKSDKFDGTKRERGKLNLIGGIVTKTRPRPSKLVYTKMKENS